MENGFQGKEGQNVPEMTDDFINQISERYIELFEKITGEKFIRADITNIRERIEKNCNKFMESLK
jgi:phosphoribosylaminoimidazole-succinocarboxamide synthase